MYLNNRMGEFSREVGGFLRRSRLCSARRGLENDRRAMAACATFPATDAKREVSRSGRETLGAPCRLEHGVELNLHLGCPGSPYRTPLIC